jgi:hypothetical protein
MFFFSGEMLIIGIYYKNDVDALKVKISPIHVFQNQKYE